MPVLAFSFLSIQKIPDFYLSHFKVKMVLLLKI